MAGVVAVAWLKAGYKGTKSEISREFAMFLPLTPLPPLPATLRCGGDGEEKPEESGVSGIVPASEQTETRCCSLFCHVPAIAWILLCFPLALQRGFASVAGRGDARRAGVRVTRFCTPLRSEKRGRLRGFRVFRYCRTFLVARGFCILRATR